MSERVARRVSRASARTFMGAPDLGRQARRVRRRNLVVGEVITMLPESGEVFDYLTVRAPNGLVLLVPPENGSFSLWLAQPGEWTYRWGGGEEQTLEVSPALAVVEEVEVKTPRLRTRLTSRGA